MSGTFFIFTDVPDTAIVLPVSEQSSRLRKKLLAANEVYQSVLQGLVAERGPLLRGSFGTRARVCGGATCRCTRGELHESKYLTASDHGKVR